MKRTSPAPQAFGLRTTDASTASSFPTTAQHLRDGREAIRGAIRH